MTDPVFRSLNLVNELRSTLDHVEKHLNSGNTSDADAKLIESMLIDRRWTPGSMGLTGPAGYDPKGGPLVPLLTGPSGYKPKAIFEKCPDCKNYRLKS